VHTKTLAISLKEDVGLTLTIASKIQCFDANFAPKLTSLTSSKGYAFQPKLLVVQWPTL
jgi:hypothetical protein